MRIISVGTAALFLAIVSATALWPENAVFGSPNKVMAQEAAVENTETKPAVAEKPVATENPTAPGEQNDFGPSAATLKARAIRKTLNTPCSLEYVELPFADVRRELENTYGLNIVLDASAIDDCLTEEELITVTLGKLRLSNALRIMLRDFNATYLIKDGVIRIISLDNVGDSENFAQRIDSVKSLLQRIGSYDSGTSESVPSPESQLIETITNVVQPDRWVTSKHGEATIDIIGGVLVTRGPESLLDDVTDFLRDLEAEM